MNSYSEVVRKHFHEPRHMGRLPDADAEGHAGGRRAGPYMHFAARLTGDLIEELGFETFGCAAAIAAGSLLCERLRGATLKETADWSEERLLVALGGLPEHKRFCAALAIEALGDLLVNLCLEYGRRQEEEARTA